ncbi:MAG: GDSL-type esterase/lipase family protein [Thermodesulfobacteriota bacterium]
MKRTLALLVFLVLALSFLGSCSGGGGGSSGSTLKKEDLIIMLGNSITARGNWGALLPNNTVLNMGVGGDRTSGMLSRLSSALARNPKVICVMGGINDLIAHASVNSVYSNLEQIVLRAKAAGVFVILQGTLMTGNLYPNAGTLNPAIRDQLNPMLSALAGRESNVRYLDMNRFLGNGAETKDEYLTADHLHINDAAYGVWATELQKVLP